MTFLYQSTLMVHFKRSDLRVITIPCVLTLIDEKNDKTMETKIKELLNTWALSLDKVQTIDSPSLKDDYILITEYICNGENEKLRSELKTCRDYSLRSDIDPRFLIQIINTIVKTIDNDKI